MSTLVIDTSDLPLVALVGETVVAERGRDQRHHAEMLTPMVEKVLAEAGVDRPDLIVVGTGPAAFTGLRAGIVTARALARAWGVDLVGVSSLDALAATALDDDGEIQVVLDARRKEVYSEVARRVGENIEVVSGPSVCKPEDVAGRPSVGPGVAVYPDVIEGTDLAIDPVAMVRLAHARRSAGADVSTEPLYLRRPDIHGA